MPMREMVAGEADERSCDSNRKLTLGPNWILSPDGMVSSLERERDNASMEREGIVRNLHLHVVHMYV